MNLKEISLENITKGIGAEAFGFCENLVVLGWPESIDSIGSKAFEYCNNLEIVNITDSFGINSQRAFIGCQSIKELKIKRKYSLGQGTFESCTGLKKVDFSGSSLAEINANLFANCTSLETVIFVSSITAIRKNGFQNTKIAELDLLKVSTIEEYSFANTMIRSVRFGATPNIKIHAFDNCQNLEKIILGSDVQKFNLLGFATCQNIKTFELDSNNYFTFNFGYLIANSMLYAYIGSDNKVELTETSVDSFAFILAKKLDTLIIKYSVLNQYSLGFIPSLRSFQYICKDDVTIYSLPSNLLTNCSKLTDVILPRQITRLGDSTFYGCTSLVKIDLSYIAEIPDNCFYGCEKLSQVQICDRLISIGSYAFANTKITQFAVPDTTLSIDESAFYNCTKLANFKFGKAVEAIKEMLFVGTALKSLTIPNSITDIATDAFKDLNIKISFENGMHPIFDFKENCLYNKVIGELITTIGKLPSVFSVPNFIKTITKGSIKSSVSSQAINGNEIRPTSVGTTVIIIPSSVTNIEADAFSNVEFLYTLCYDGYAVIDNVNGDNKYLTNAYVTKHYTYSQFYGIDVKVGDCSKDVPAELSGNYIPKKTKAALISLIVITVILSLAIIGLLVFFFLIKNKTKAILSTYTEIN